MKLKNAKIRVSAYLDGRTYFTIWKKGWFSWKEIGRFESIVDMANFVRCYETYHDELVGYKIDV